MEIEKHEQMADPEDIELQKVMGDKWHTLEEWHAEVEAAKRLRESKEEKKEETPVENEPVLDAPFTGVENGFTTARRLKNVVLSAAPYAIACFVLWYWQMVGAMDAEVAQAASTVCAVLAALFGGRAAWK